MNRLSFGALVACVLLCVLDSSLAAVGRTEAAFGVSSTGAAQYSIGIFAPPGTAGMTPTISLNYSSSVSNGLAGTGFFIGGLSQISRCNRSLDQDGAASAPRMVTTDRYCLDGMQLKFDSTTATYRTEIESFSRVTANGTAGNGPAYFIVEQKNGLIFEYGNTADSRIEGLTLGGGGTVPTVRTWALNKIRDRAGNAIEFTYIEDTANGSFRPNEIRWTSNPGQGLSAAYKIVFVYETATRPDVLYGYRFGNQSAVDGKINETKRIDRIDVFYNTSTLVRRYELTYEVSGVAGASSRLQSIQECGLGGSDCLAATSFSWINGTLSWNAEASTGQAVPTQPMIMDINNDGRDDLVYSNSTTSGSGVWYYMLASSGGGYSAPVSTGQTNTNFTQALQLDLDGDGREDFIVPNASNQWTYFHANGSGFDTAVSTGVAWASADQWWTADVNGDGRGDLLRLANSAFGVRIHARFSTGTGFGAESFLVEHYDGSGSTEMRPNTFGLTTRARSATRNPDFNGDGREDFIILVRHTSEPDFPNPLVINNYLCQVLGGDGIGACIFTGTGVGAVGLPLTWFMGDGNGDGLTDLFVVNVNNTATFIPSRGDFLGVSSAPVAFSTYTAAAARSADWDGDGRDDVIAPNSSGVLWVSRSTGAALSSTFVNTGVNSGTGNFPSVGDINGDGLSDLMRQNGSSWVYSTHLGVPWDMLNIATDGYGNTVNFDYVSITQNNYSITVSPTYPERLDQRPRYVVNQYTASNGIGGTYTMSYWYYDSLTHQKGRGFEGFRARRSQDSRNGLWAYDYFKQLFPYTGMLQESALYQTNNTTLIARQQNSFSSSNLGTGFETRVFPFVSGSTQNRWEVGGTYNGVLMSTAATTNTWSSTSGTLTDSTTVITEGVSGNGINAGQTWTQRTWHSALFNDTTNWCLGRPSTTQQINSHTMYGGSMLTRTLTTSWDGPACRPTQLVTQSGDASWQVTLVPGYDGFGNVNSRAVTGAGMSARTTTTGWGTTGQFPTTITNALSQTTTNAWDFARGVPSSQTDPNGIVVSWTYDNFGRRIRENRPDSTATTWAYNDCSSIGCVNSNNKMVVVETSLNTTGGTIRDQYTYLDKLDRPLVTRAQTLSGAYNRIELQYDAQGRLNRESSPCWWGSCTSSTSFWTRYTYDVLDRLTQTSRPINDSSGVFACAPGDASPPCQHTIVSYEGLTTRSTDAEGKVSLKIASGGGTLARSQDHAGYNQTFDYDAFANLLRVSDNASSTTTLQSYTYNINGARLTSSDVDLGNWTYTPNALGEVVSQQDANGNTTSFAYDLLGRMTSRTFPNAGGSITSTYTFGTSSAAKNIGKLSWQEISGTGITTYRETYTYDSIGRPSQTEYKEGASTFYYVNMGYASTTGFLESLTYPESSSSYRLKLRYEYQFGLPYRVSEFNTGTRFWLASSSDARGNVIDETVGNPGEVGLYQTISGFDQITGRLDYLQTGAGGGAATQNLAYEWDRVGNLKRRIDVNQSNLTEEFFYDNLHRLDYSTLNGSTNLDVGYDARGNITSKTGVGAYTYHASKLHAVSSINTGSGTLSYSYDSNGNMTNRAGTTITWYANNLPKSITLNSSNSSRHSSTHRTASVGSRTIAQTARRNPLCTSALCSRSRHRARSLPSSTTSVPTAKRLASTSAKSAAPTRATPLSRTI